MEVQFTWSRMERYEREEVKKLACIGLLVIGICSALKTFCVSWHVLSFYGFGDVPFRCDAYRVTYHPRSSVSQKSSKPQSRRCHRNPSRRVNRKSLADRAGQCCIGCIALRPGLTGCQAYV